VGVLGKIKKLEAVEEKADVGTKSLTRMQQGGENTEP